MTSGAKPSASGASAGDLMLGSIVRSLVDAAVHFGGLERAPLIEAIGLRAEELDDPDGLVPLAAYVAAWEALAAKPGNEEVGLKLGALSSPQYLGALGYAMVHAPSGVAAIQLFQRFRKLVSDTLAPEIAFEDEQVVYRLVWPARIARVAQFADCAFAGTQAMQRALMGLSSSTQLLREVWYQCPRPLGIDRAQALGCPVRFGAPESRAVLWRAPLERPLPRHDPALFAYLERHAQTLLAGMPQGEGMVERVQRLITEALRGGEPAQADVARKLALSERTLQRRLREANTSFAQLLDGVRQQLARLYLSDRALGLHEVAFLLGYSEPSAFHRAFRRWTGQTPQAFRSAQARA